MTVSLFERSSNGLRSCGRVVVARTGHHPVFETPLAEEYTSIQAGREMTMSPITAEEAAYNPTKGKRHGRQRGAWVYLDAALLERVGVQQGEEFEVMRYALVERRRLANGGERVRGRVVLNIRLLGQHDLNDRDKMPCCTKPAEWHETNDCQDDAHRPKTEGMR